MKFSFNFPKISKINYSFLVKDKKTKHTGFARDLELLKGDSFQVINYLNTTLKKKKNGKIKPN